MTLGNAIKLIRTARGTRQRHLAEEIGVSANYLSMVEADRREPSIAILKQVARQLEVPAGLFLLWAESDQTKLRPSKIKQLRELLIEIQAIYLEQGKDSGKERPVASTR